VVAAFVGVSEPAAPRSRTLSTEELARESGVALDQVRRLLEAGAIQPDRAGEHDVADVARVRLATALTDGGIEFDDLMEVLQNGALELDWVARLWSISPPSGRTFGEFAVSLGARGEQLPSVYGAFGLAVPPAETVMQEDEERALTDFIDLWAMVDDRPETFVRAARIAGEGVSRIQGGSQDLFDELGGAPGSPARQGMPLEEAIRPATRFSPTMAELLVWLQKRHMENEVFGRVVAYVEYVLAETGHVDRRTLPAIAFVDLSGYTQLTVEAGDERGAQFAATLQALAESVARVHRGRVVKLLGDGVMLRYNSAPDAVRSVTQLMAAIVEAGLPAGHAGIAAGPLVVRDGDVYGHTVNLASRLAGHAQVGEVLVPETLTADLDAAEFGWTEIGSAQLKGITEPIRLARIVPPRV
jgi:adenylate cyclase